MPVARHRPRMPVAPSHCVRAPRCTVRPLAGRTSLHRQADRWPGPSRLVLADVVRCHIVSAHRATADQAPHPIRASPSSCSPSLNDPLFRRRVLLVLVVLVVVLPYCGAYSSATSQFQPLPHRLPASSASSHPVSFDVHGCSTRRCLWLLHGRVDCGPPPVLARHPFSKFSACPTPTHSRFGCSGPSITCPAVRRG